MKGESCDSGVDGGVKEGEVEEEVGGGGEGKGEDTDINKQDEQEDKVMYVILLKNFGKIVFALKKHVNNYGYLCMKIRLFIYVNLVIYARKSGYLCG